MLRKVARAAAQPPYRLFPFQLLSFLSLICRRTYKPDVESPSAIISVCATIYEDGRAEFFMDLDEAKSFLFSFRKDIRVPVGLDEKPTVYAEVRARTTKHLLLRQTELAAKSEVVLS
jgi:hypothetical protein